MRKARNSENRNQQGRKARILGSDDGDDGDDCQFCAKKEAFVSLVSEVFAMPLLRVQEPKMSLGLDGRGTVKKVRQGSSFLHAVSSWLPWQRRRSTATER